MTLFTKLDFFSRLPLGVDITHGAAHDTPIGEVLIRGAPKSLPVCGVAADKGYDSEALVCSIKQKWKGVRVAIPLRNMRQGGDSTRNMTIKRKDLSRDRSLYKKHTGIERYFSRKKGVFRLGEERTRHFKNFRANCYLTCIMEILEWSTRTGVELG